MQRQRIEFMADHARPRKTTRQSRLNKLFREVKRRLIADGKIPNPALRPKKYQFHWTVGDRDQGGIVLADHTGEARGLIKKQIGIKRGRLPQCIKIVRIPNDATLSPGDLPFSIGPIPPGTDPDNLGGTS